MQQFDLVLKNEKVKVYERLGVFVFILNAVLIIYFSFPVYFQHFSEKIIESFAVIALVLLVFFHLFSRAHRFKEISFIAAVAGIAFFWLFTGHWATCLIMLLLFFLYKIAKRTLRVSVSAATIIYPSFPATAIPWADLSNVVLKDGILTIDFRNNKIIQQLTEEKTSALNEKEFNDFCRAQLNQ